MFDKAARQDEALDLQLRRVALLTADQFLGGLGAKRFPEQPARGDAVFQQGALDRLGVISQ